MLRRILSILTTLGAIAFVVLTTIVLVAFGRGYSYDLIHHRVTLNGLIIMSSTPSGATILQNGKDIKRRTPYRVTLETGDYQFEVHKDGYRDWKKTLHSEASEVTWAQYIWLLPDTLKDSTVTTFPGIAEAVPSKDHRHLAIITTGTDTALWQYDSSNKAMTKIYVPTAATADTPAEALTDVSWSDDNTHLLLRSTVGTKVVVQIVQPGQATINLTDTFKYDFSTLKFSPNNWRELYWMSPEGLRKLDIGAQTVSAVLADNVLSFGFGSDRILYVQTTKLGQSLFSMDHSGKDKKELVQSVADSDTYSIAEVTYRDKDLLAILPAKARTLTLYTDIYSDNPVSKVISKDTDHFVFNGDGRFLAFYSANATGTYDSEKSQTYNLGAGIDGVGWFDTYHLLGVRDGQAHFMEFDGGNDATIGGATPGLPFMATSDQKSFLRFVTSGDGKLQLVSTDTHK